MCWCFEHHVTCIEVKGSDFHRRNFKHFNSINVTERSEVVTWMFFKRSDEDEKKELTSGILWLYVTCIIKSHKPFIHVSSSISPFFFFLIFVALMFLCLSLFSTAWMFRTVVTVLKTAMNEQSLLILHRSEWNLKKPKCWASNMEKDGICCRLKTVTQYHFNLHF